MTRDNPVWKYLCDAPIAEHHLTSGAWNNIYGKFMERIAHKIIRDTYRHPEHDFKIDFPNFIETLSTSWIPHGKMSILKGQADGVLVICGKNKIGYSKKAIIFEIKSGVSNITPAHIDFWNKLFLHPDQYVRECDELKLYVLWIHGIDPHAHRIFYTIKNVELEKIPEAELDESAYQKLGDEK